MSAWCVWLVPWGVLMDNVTAMAAIDVIFTGAESSSPFRDIGTCVVTSRPASYANRKIDCSVARFFQWILSVYAYTVSSSSSSWLIFIFFLCICKSLSKTGYQIYSSVDLSHRSRYHWQKFSKACIETVRFDQCMDGC